MEFITDNEYTLIIRYNPKKNTGKSDGTIMYSKSNNSLHPTYSKLQQGTQVCIIGSKLYSGIILFSGVLNKTPEYLKTDQVHRFTDPYKYEYINTNVWKFSISIVDNPNIDITDEPEWNKIKRIIFPVLI